LTIEHASSGLLGRYARGQPRGVQGDEESNAGHRVTDWAPFTRPLAVGGVEEKRAALWF